MSQNNQETDELIRKISEASMSNSTETPDYDSRMIEAVECVINAGFATAVLIQRELKVGYARAGRMLDDMEQLGIVGSAQGSAPRDVLITIEEWTEKRAELFSDTTADENFEPDSPSALIKDLPYSDSLKSELYRYVDQVKAQNFTYCNCAIIGCTFIEAYSIIPAIASELNVKYTIEIAFYPDSIESKITEMPDRSIIGFCQMNEISPDSTKNLNRALLNNAMTITRYESGGVKEEVTLPKWLYIICAEKKSEIPVEIREGLYKEIDLSKYALDFKVYLIRQTMEKYGLTVDDEKLLWEIAKACPQNDLITPKVIEIRNRAFEDGTTVISEKHLSDNCSKVEGLDAVDCMEGRDFEIFTGNLLRGNGFTNIQVTPASGDFGADVIAEKDGVKYAIQCKRYSSPVGVSAVQEVIASKSLHECHVACVLTNSSYTPAAIELAKKNLVILWDRAELKNLIDKASSNG